MSIGYEARGEGVGFQIYMNSVGVVGRVGHFTIGPEARTHQVPGDGRGIYNVRTVALKMEGAVGWWTVLRCSPRVTTASRPARRRQPILLGDKGLRRPGIHRVVNDMDATIVRPRGRRAQPADGLTHCWGVATAALGTMHPVPTISRFFGIAITMYFDDHGFPHFHARHASGEAKVRIDTLEVIESALARRQLRLVLAWAELHQDELAENWQRARAGETLHEIEPLG